MQMQHTREQDVVELEVAVDDLRVAAVQVRQPLRDLDGPAQRICICVDDLRAAAQAFVASSKKDLAHQV